MHDQTRNHRTVGRGVVTNITHFTSFDRWRSLALRNASDGQLDLAVGVDAQAAIAALQGDGAEADPEKRSSLISIQTRRRLIILTSSNSKHIGPIARRFSQQNHVDVLASSTAVLDCC